MATYVYREQYGEVIKTEIPGRKLRGCPIDFHKPYQERMLRSYYEAECAGIPWNQPLTKSQTKRVHEHALAQEAK